jgi:prolyl oligopeptidase
MSACRPGAIAHPASRRPRWSARWTSTTASGIELVSGDDDGDELVRLDVPTDAGIGVHRNWLLIRPRTDWTVGDHTYPAGSLLAARYAEFLSGVTNLDPVFTPDEHTFLSSAVWTRDRMLLVTLRDVIQHVQIVTPGAWERHDLPGRAAELHDRDRGRRPSTATRSSWIPAVSTTVPTAVRHRWTASSPRSKRPGNVRRHRPRPSSSTFATSADGTRIPYFVVAPRFDRPEKTLLGGYGGFEVSRTAGLHGGAGPAVAGPRRHLRAGQHPRRRRVRAPLAHPGTCDAGGTWSPRTSPPWQGIW